MQQKMEHIMTLLLQQRYFDYFIIDRWEQNNMNEWNSVRSTYYKRYIHGAIYTMFKCNIIVLWLLFMIHDKFI